MKKVYRFPINCERFLLPVTIYNPQNIDSKKVINALLDTGSQLLIARKDILQGLGISIDTKSTLNVHLAGDNHNMESYGTAEFGLDFGEGFDLNVMSDVFEGIKEDMIIGVKFLGAMSYFSLEKKNNNFKLTIEMDEE